MKIRWSGMILVTGITILCLFLLDGSAGASPPPAILEIDGKEQSAGIGSSCWKVENETYSLCVDMIGAITPAEPLLTRSPFTAILRLPLQEPHEELEFSTFRVTDDDELKVASNGCELGVSKVLRLTGTSGLLSASRNLISPFLPGFMFLTYLQDGKGKVMYPGAGI